jgi:hypothetical protein
MLLVRRHHRAGPRAIESLAAALSSGSVRFVTGDVRATAAGLTIDPIAIVTDRLIVPDIEENAPSIDLPVGSVPSSDGPIGEAVHRAASCLEEACHLGLARTSVQHASRATAAADALDAVGLRECAVRVRAFATDRSPRAWRSAAIRLAVTEAVGV